MFVEFSELRRVRTNMMYTFVSYKMMYQCLSWYGKNNAKCDQLKPEDQVGCRQQIKDDVISKTALALNTDVNNSRRDDFEDETYFTGLKHAN